MNPLPVSLSIIPFKYISYYIIDLFQYSYKFLIFLFTRRMRSRQFRATWNGNGVISLQDSALHENAIMLWNNGCFGKASLSRGYPSWWSRHNSIDSVQDQGNKIKNHYKFLIKGWL